MVSYALTKQNKKITVHQLQKICGFLNFLSKAIVPGRAFTRRCYKFLKGDLKQYHHIRVSKELRKDLQIWLMFLKHPSAVSRPFADFSISIDATELDFYTDAAKNLNLGFGGKFTCFWMMQKWDPVFHSKSKSQYTIFRIVLHSPQEL